MPFPNDEVTPPVTKMYLVMMICVFGTGFYACTDCLCTGYKSSKNFRLCSLKSQMLKRFGDVDKGSCCKVGML